MPTPEVTGYAALQSEEIKKIAREYVKEILSKQPVRHHAIPEIWAKAVADTERALAELYEPLIAHISKGYCIVPKDVIRKEYEKAKSTHDIYTSATCINEMESRAIDHAEGRMCELTTLFGKELFEEGKE